MSFFKEFLFTPYMYKNTFVIMNMFTSAIRNIASVLHSDDSDVGFAKLYHHNVLSADEL